MLTTATPFQYDSSAKALGGQQLRIIGNTSALTFGPNVVLQLDQAFTVMMWIKIESLFNNMNGVIWRAGDAADGNSIELRVSSMLELVVADQTNTVSTGIKLAFDQRHHLAVSVGGMGEVELILDG